MVGQVVVDAGSAPSLLLLVVAEVAAVAVLVVAPQQGDVVGHFQAVMIGVEHLLVGAQHLGNLVDGLADVAAQHVALVVNGPLHQGHALLRGVGALHGVVVDAAQA